MSPQRQPVAAAKRSGGGSAGGDEAALLERKVAALQALLAALPEAPPPGLALQLVQKEPRLLTTKNETMHAALAWLLQQFGGDSQRVLAVLGRSPKLLSRSADDLQRRADYLQGQLGWQAGDGQLAAWIAASPRPFADCSFGSADKQALLRLYTGVLGLPLTDCLDRWSGYLGRGLATTAARYTLVQVRAAGGPAALPPVPAAPHPLHTDTRAAAAGRRSARPGCCSAPAARPLCPGWSTPPRCWPAAAPPLLRR